MASLQPMLWIDDIETAMTWYRDRLGCEVDGFDHDADGRVIVCAAKLEGALILITRDPVMALDGAGTGSGHVRVYIHLDSPVDELHRKIEHESDVAIVQPPTDQWWGDRTCILRDPWGTTLVLSNEVA